MALVRLCRQRQPFLPTTSASRPLTASILDILVDAINHNLRRRLDLALYVSCVGLVHRLVSYLIFTRTRFPYHWSLLWQTLLSLLRFLTTYSDSLRTDHHDLRPLFKPLLATLALSVTVGDAFLPDPGSYDDLFYKLVEAGEYLIRFKTAFKLDQADTNEKNDYAATTVPIDILIQVSKHYQQLIDEGGTQGRISKNLSPREVSKVIRQGYETLSLPTTEGLDHWATYREAEEKGMIKKAARTAVEDTKQLLRL